MSKPRSDRPPGVRIEYAGQFEQEEAAARQLLWFAALAMLGIAIVVGLTLGSVRRTLIVLSNLPLALAGGVAGVHLAGGVLSVATTIGFITLFGIATRNGILLATRARDLELEGEPREAAAARAAQERLAPILMTAATAALGSCPLRSRSAGLAARSRHPWRSSSSPVSSARRRSTCSSCRR